jgi:hypothetical protein
VKHIIAVLVFGLAALTCQAQLESNAIPGLALPAPQTVQPDASYVVVSAQATGPVRFLVLSTTEKIKFRVNPKDAKELIVGIPPRACQITIFANTVLDKGELSDYVRTDITVDGPAPAPPQPPGPPAPEPPSPVPPLPLDLKYPLDLNLIFDQGKISEDLFDEDVREYLVSKQTRIFLHDESDDELQRNYNFGVVLAGKSRPFLIVQDATGRGLIATELPPTSAAFLSLLQKSLGQ